MASYMHAAARKLSRVLVACLFCLGFWQLGQGAYIPAKAWLAQELMQRAWVRTSTSESRQAPWPWADTWPVARLKANSGNIDLIVLAGDSGRTLAFGPGHVSASALPGTVGNTVIGGHRDTHFRFLQHAQLGDEFVLESSDGEEHRYRVFALDIVDSRSASLLLDTPSSIVSLVTCYPFDATEAGGPLRYVVSAKKLD